MSAPLSSVARNLACLGLCACLGACAAPPKGSPSSASDPPLQALGLLGVDGAATTLESLATGDAGPVDLLAVRVISLWCGTCRWDAAQWAAGLASEARARIRLIDVVVAGADNNPATVADAQALLATRSEQGSLPSVVITSGSTSIPRMLVTVPSALPLVALVDVRTWQVAATLSNPSQTEFEGALAAALAELDQLSPPAPAAANLVDGRFATHEWSQIAGMQLTAPAADPSNAVADNALAAALGEKLFFSKTLSPKGVGCVSCHQPDLLFTDGKETPPEGAAAADRNAPTTLFAGYHATQLWDGRADSTWMQALLPIEADSEFDSSRLFAVHAVFDAHRSEYEAVFGPLPDLSDEQRFAREGGPGDDAWNALTEPDRATISRAFVNIGKAIAAYERSVKVLPNAFDRYIAGEMNALTVAQKDGLKAFLVAGCAQCHWGPQLSDDSFHNLRFPSGRHDRVADPGRAEGVAQLLGSEFHRGSEFSDAAETFVVPVSSDSSLGAFKTPGLRGVGFTLPYGHGGSYWGLRSVIDAHRTRGLPPSSPYAVGEAEFTLPSFAPELIPQLVEFLNVLRADPVSAAQSD